MRRRARVQASTKGLDRLSRQIDDLRGEIDELALHGDRGEPGDEWDPYGGDASYVPSAGDPPRNRRRSAP